MLRLTFFDGTGLDYAYSISANHKFLFYLTIIYMCVTTFGVINGMIGIFGTVFANAAEESFEEYDHEGMAEDNGDDDHHSNGEKHSRSVHVGDDAVEMNPMPSSPSPPSPSSQDRPLTPNSLSSKEKAGIGRGARGEIREGEVVGEDGGDARAASVKRTGLFSTRRLVSPLASRGESMRMMDSGGGGELRQLKAEVEQLKGEVRKVTEVQEQILKILQNMQAK